MHKIMLVIVDDHEIVREGLKLALQCESDFEIIGQASNGKDLMKLLNIVYPDVILLDERMPEASGIDICKILTKSHPDIKIIILTAYAEQEKTIVQAMMAGAKGFLVKNVELFELKRSIRAVARGETVLDSQLTVHLVDKLKEGGSNKDSQSLILTEQHIVIARLVAQGLTNREIAEQLYLSENTIKFHVQNMMRKMDVHNRVALVAKLIQSNILT